MSNMINKAVKVKVYWNQTKGHNNLGDNNQTQDIVILAEFTKNGNTHYLGRVGADVVNFEPTHIIELHQ